MSSSKKRRKPPLLSRLFFSGPMLFLTSWFARVVTVLLFSTLRVKMHGTETLTKAGRQRLIIALWHDKLLLAPFVARILKQGPIAVVVSKSRDGRLLSAYANTFSYVKSINVSHKNRHGALLQMCAALEEGAKLVITPDGPRGPKYQVKAGIMFSSERAQASIVAMRWQASSSWKLNTWDNLQIPKPFAKVSITFEPVMAGSVDDLQSKLSN